MSLPRTKAKKLMKKKLGTNPKRLPRELNPLMMKRVVQQEKMARRIKRLNRLMKKKKKALRAMSSSSMANLST